VFVGEESFAFKGTSRVWGRSPVSKIVWRLLHDYVRYTGVSDWVSLQLKICREEIWIDVHLTPSTKISFFLPPEDNGKD
jgi:hypothetical protein